LSVFLKKGDKKMKKVMYFIAFAIVIGTTAAYAATTQNVAMNIEIPTVIGLSWTVVGTPVNLTGVDAISLAEFASGFRTNIHGGTLGTTANANYDLTVKASGIFFGGGSTTKQTSDLLVNLDTTPFVYTPLNGTNEVTLISNHAVETNGPKAVLYRINLFPADSAGIYTTTLTYTIKAHI
jgi:hypothetical protein